MAEYESFLDQMIQWFGGHQEQLDEPSRQERIGTNDLGIPCQQFQVRMLAQLLKTGNGGRINYMDVSRQLQAIRLESKGNEVDTHVSEDMKRERGDARTQCSCGGTGGPICLEVNEEKLQRCPHCQLGLWSPNHPGSERFIHLSIRLIPFDHHGGTHSGNFEVALPTSSRVFSLIREIRERVGIQSSRLEVFRTRVPSEQSYLPPESSLEESGFIRGPKESPLEATVFYDYRLEFSDCPILNCDHYFGSKLSPAGKGSRTGLAS